MIPNNDDDLDGGLETDFEEEIEPNLTYKMDFANQVIIGKCDGEEAMKQAITKRLATELYEDIIYDVYGIELNDLVGEDMPYVVSEIQERITEALLDDDRVDEVTDFDINVQGNKVTASFTVVTKEGNIPIEEGVTLNV